MGNYSSILLNIHIVQSIYNQASIMDNIEGQNTIMLFCGGSHIEAIHKPLEMMGFVLKKSAGNETDYFNDLSESRLRKKIKNIKGLFELYDEIRSP